MQFRVFGNLALHEDRRRAGAQAHREPVDHGVERELLDVLRVLVAGGQGVEVRHEEVAVVLVLKLHPVLQGAVVVADVHAAGRPHPRQYPLIGVAAAHVLLVASSTTS